MQAPPITDPPTQTHLSGKIVWHDLLTGDLNASKQFYQALFGWTFKQTDHYTIVLNHGSPIAGMVQIDDNGNHQPARWLVSLSVDDVDQAAETVKNTGGAVHEGPAKLENRGQYALISDPDGAELVLLNSDSGDPKDLTPKSGAWLWNELWTQDVQKALDFYRKLAGYSLTPLSSDYTIVQKHEIWRAGIRPALIDGIHSRWIPVIRVDDPDLIAKRLEPLGGQRLLETHQPDSDAKIILAADPTGALFMVQNWPDSILTQKE
ncbi:MAG: VOC family protein [Gammaproteobacteria bacterium]